jgi:hypothetical protein
MGTRVLTKLKPDYVALQRRRKDARPPERLIAHYELERRLADRLRAACRDERSRLYTEVYSELFNSLPDHPQKTAVGSRTDRIAKQVRLLKPLMRRGDVYLDIGCGDALLPFALSGFAREVLSLDVTDALVDFAAAAGCNFGSSICRPSRSSIKGGNNGECQRGRAYVKRSLYRKRLCRGPSGLA